ncbi:MAG: hypothetical protein L0Z62_04490 [Gemmataceae bacterium]|nr:hypothetical protein [Gemmataceae bacterium]
MDCAEEVAVLKREVGPLVGGEGNLAFDILNGKMTVSAAVGEVSAETVRQAVARTGMRAEAWGEESAEPRDEGFWQRRGRTVLTAASGLLLVTAFGLHAWRAGGIGAALGRATLGIAMGAAGSDAAIETADIALMSDDLLKLPWLVRHSRRTLTVIRQNIVFSLSVKAAFVVLTFVGYASLWAAIAADMGASLLVIFNGLRLLHARA